MQRDIKFRAWYESEKRMIDWEELKYDVDMVYIFDNEISDVSPVMQYTGLKDKNGVEIYEGDIVCEKIGFGTESRAPKNKPHVFTLGVVAWFEDHWGISHEMNHDQYWDDVRGNATDWYRVHYGLRNTEVIGNIYENPELLETDTASNSEETPSTL